MDQKTEKMLRIAYIVNNFDKTYDGVGVFGAKMHTFFPDWIDDTIYSSACPQDSKMNKIFTLGMTKCLFRAYLDVKRKRYDMCLMEYPFYEWQPLILAAYIMMVRAARRTNTKVVISLHEYLRGHWLRRMVTRQLCKRADAVIVTDQAMAESVRGFTHKTFLRPIPINVYDGDTFQASVKRDRNSFVFFGIVSPKTKAFDELLEAWDAFNAEGKYQLSIISVTDLGNIENEHKGIRYYHDIGDAEVIRIHRESTFCLLPIKPQIDMRSGTFKACCMCGCIGIGKFPEGIECRSFVIPVESYEREVFSAAMRDAVGMPQEKITEMSQMAAEWGEKYTPENTATLVADHLRTIVSKG